MRSGAAAAGCLIGALCACGGGTPSPSLAISPAGPLKIAGPVSLLAVATHSQSAVTWSLVGPGSLSGTAGREVVYQPPSPIGCSQSATVTAQIDGATAGVQLNLCAGGMPDVKIPGLGGPVQVSYDAQDIPHVFCVSTADCFAVQGYLHARDRLFPMDFLRHVARGRLSELIGTLGLDQDLQLRTLFTTRDGKRIEDALAAAMDPDTSAKLTAYAKGVNAYLAQLRADPQARLPGEYAQLPFPLSPADIPDWTVQDTWALSRLQQFQLSESLGEESSFGKFAAVYGPGAPLEDLGKLNTWIRAAAPPTAQTHTLTGQAPGPGADQATPPRTVEAPQSSAGAPPPRIAEWGASLAAVSARFAVLRAALKPLGETVGSNNWVVDAAHSANGHAMVANDPHLSLKYPPLFHLISLTSSTASDNLNLSGGAFPGIPGALVGRGAHVGWGVTVVGYDVTDLYLEQFVDAGHVAFKNSLVGIAIYPQVFHVRTAQGLLPASDVTKVVAVVPHHGPLIQAPDGAGKAVSVRWTGHESYTQDVKGFFGLNTATGVDDAMTALKNYSTGAQNFVLADDQGHIAYDPHALVPKRDFADPSSPAHPGSAIPPWFPLPGDGTAEWGSGVAGDNCAGSGSTIPAAACWIPDAQLPQGKDPARGYFATANADPLGVSDDNNPLAHQPYLSFDWDDSTGFRHARIVKRLKDALVTGSGKISLDDMQSIQADHVSNLAAVFTAYVAGMPAGSADFEFARTMLAQWTADGLDCPTGLVGVDPAASPPDPDPTRTRDSAATLLFHSFLRTLLQNVFADDLAVAGMDLGPVQAVKGMIYMLDPATPGGDQAFCNDVDASGTEIRTHTCGEQVAIALVQAYRGLSAVLGPPPAKWRWGRFHTIQPTSQLALVTTGYGPGPFARPGGAFTVDVGSPSLSGAGLSFGYGSGGNVRHISVMDPATPVIKMQLPGPERDGPTGIFSSGPNLLLDWVQNKYFDFALGAQVTPLAVAAQNFNPQ